MYYGWGLLAPRQHYGTTPHYRGYTQPFEAQGAPLEPKAIRVIGFGSWLAEGLRASASNDMQELSISASREYAAKSVVQGNQRCKAGERCNATDRASVVHSNQPGKRHRGTKSNG